MSQAGTPEKVCVCFKPSDVSVEAEAGANLLDVAVAAGVEIEAPCGGQGRCGRCAVHVVDGEIDRRSGAKLTSAQEDEGQALACQAFVLSDVTVEIPQHKVVTRKPRDEVSAEPSCLPFGCDWRGSPAIRLLDVKIDPPSLEDNTSDLDRVRRELLHQHGIDDVAIDLGLLKKLGKTLRAADWHVAITIEMGNVAIVPHVPPRILAIAPHDHPEGTFGLAIDIGTTSVVVYLIDFASAKVVHTVSAYNGQISCGDDIISRIVYSQRDNGLDRLQRLIMDTINDLIDELVDHTKVRIAEIHEVIVAGNTTMVHLLLGLDPKYLREEPYTPMVSYPSQILAGEIGLAINPLAGVRCVPGVGSYVGGDITSGVISSGMFKTDKLTLFIDIGTNGEIVLGDKDWLISCACSAGPAFEGGGVVHGMRATHGAIEEVWVNDETFEPGFRTIDDVPALGICGSGLIDLLGEMFVAGVIDKSGRIHTDLDTPRTRIGDSGPEYIVAWAAQTGTGTEIVITEADINNLIRAKGAIYAGFAILCRSVGVELADVQEVLIGGAFGKYINIERAIQIGLMPDLPIERFRFLGNTSALGAYTVLLCTAMRFEMLDVAAKMTYLELSTDNSYMDEYMSALFLPHTDMEAFPTVKALIESRNGGGQS